VTGPDEGGEVIRRSHILTAAALLAVSAAPASAATWEDLRGSKASYGPAEVAPAEAAPPPSSIAKDAAREYQALRSPDESPYVLNRGYGSPDAVDAARDLPPVQIPATVVRDTPSSGFDWGDAGIGAAGMLALFGIGTGSALLIAGRRRRHGLSVATH
jgi:hypothetical protein